MKDEVKEVLRKELATLGAGAQPPGDDDDLFAAGFLDSLNFVQLLVFIRKHFGVSFERSELRLENFSSINQIAARLKGRRGG